MIRAAGPTSSHRPVLTPARRPGISAARPLSLSKTTLHIFWCITPTRTALGHRVPPATHHRLYIGLTPTPLHYHVHILASSASSHNTPHLGCTHHLPCFPAANSLWACIWAFWIISPAHLPCGILSWDLHRYVFFPPCIPAFLHPMNDPSPPPAPPTAAPSPGSCTHAHGRVAFRPSHRRSCARLRRGPLCIDNSPGPTLFFTAD